MIVLREFVVMLYYKIATNLKEAQKSIQFPKEFNGLKTEVKLWILHSLLQYNSVSILIPMIFKLRAHMYIFTSLFVTECRTSSETNRKGLNWKFVFYRE